MEENEMNEEVETTEELVDTEEGTSIDVLNVGKKVAIGGLLAYGGYKLFKEHVKPFVGKIVSKFKKSYSKVDQDSEESNDNSDDGFFNDSEE